jgi:hypothetical protein
MGAGGWAFMDAVWGTVCLWVGWLAPQRLSERLWGLPLSCPCSPPGTFAGPSIVGPRFIEGPGLAPLIFMLSSGAPPQARV